MNPIETDTARMDAMSGGRRIARQLIASQIALSRVFDQLLPQSCRIDGSKDFKQRIVPSSYVSSYFAWAVRTATRRVKSAQLWLDAGSRAKSTGTALELS